MSSALPTTVPFVGLRPFDTADAAWFFGRDLETPALTQKIRANRFTAVVGPSGSGKSSVVRAGVVPLLQSDGWQQIIATPGSAPLAQLARALAGAEADDRLAEARRFRFDALLRASAFGLAEIAETLRPDAPRLLLVIDQFEELFRYGDEASGTMRAAMREESRAFVELLLTATQSAPVRLRVCITVRSDYFGACSAYVGLAEAISASQFLIPLPHREQLDDAIRKPVARAGAVIEEGLVQRLLVDVEEEQDQLPLLQHTLRRLWEQASGEPRTMREKDYVEVGKIAGSINKKAESIVAALSRTNSYDLATLECVMKALTDLDEHDRTTRHPRKRSELLALVSERVATTPVSAAASLDRVLGALRAEDTSFLLVRDGDDPGVDISHEALIRSWVRLSGPRRDFSSGWIREERDDGERWREYVRRAAEGATLGSRELRMLSAWPTSRGFGKAWSRRYGNQWEQVEELKQRSAHAERRQRIGMGLLSTLVIAVLWFGGYNFYRQRVEAASSRAREARSIDDAITKSSLPPEQTRISNLESAVQAFSEGNSDYGGIWATLQQVHELYRFPAKNEVHAADFASDGRSIIAIDRGGMLYQWAVEPGHKVLREFLIAPLDDKGIPAEGRALRVSPLNDMAAVGFNDGSIVLLDLTTTQKRIKALQINGAKPHVSADPDGSASVFKLAFSLDGSLLVTTSRAGNIVIWERSPSPGAQSGPSPSTDPLQWTVKQNLDLNRQGAADIWAVDIDPAKQIIAIGLGDGHICLMWLDNLEQLVCPDEHAPDKAVKSVRFLPGKAMLVSAGNDAKVTIWELDSSARHAKPQPITLAQDNAIWDVDINRNGTVLATASFDGSIRVYQTDTWRLLNAVAPDTVAWHRRLRAASASPSTVDNAFALRTVRFDPTSTMLITSSLDHTARVWTPLVDRTGFRDLGYRLPPAPNKPGRSVYSVAIDPTGDRIAFSDQTSVYLQSSGQEPKALALDLGGDQIRPRFTQVLIRAPGEIIASAVEPRLIVWTMMSDGAAWTARTVALPGDSIPPGRSAALDPSGAMLAVEVRDGDQASILLCPLHGSQPWTCATSGNSAVTKLPLDAKLALHPSDKDCAKSGSEVHVAVSKSGRLVAAGAGACPIQVFDTRNPNTSRSYAGLDKDGGINSLDFSPDERAIVAASQRWEVRVWDLAGGPSRNISHHASPFVTAARYSPSGQWIVSTSNDKTVVVSAAESGAKLVVLKYPNSLLDVVAASTPRGSMMATGSGTGDVNVMPLFENAKDISPYVTAVLQDISQ